MKTYLISAVALSCLACAAIKSTIPAKKDALAEDSVDYFHGAKVADPYRWMEVGDDAKTEEWVGKQKQRVERYFNANSVLPKIRDRLIEIEKTSQGSFSQLRWAGNKLFAIRTVPPKHQPVLVAMPSYEQISQSEIIVDPNIMDPNGSLAIDWYVPSHDGRFVAVSISRNSTEAGDLYLYDLAPKTTFPRGKKKRAGKKAKKAAPSSADVDDGKLPYEPIEAIIHNVNRATGGGALVWSVDNKGFFYTRYPDTSDITGEGSIFQKLYYHRLGKSADNDKCELGDDFDRLEQLDLEVDPRSGRVIATVQLGSGGPFSHYLRNPNGSWQQLSKFGDEIEEIIFAPKGGMFLLSRETAPRGRLHFLSSPKIPLNQAKRIVAESNESIAAGVMGAQTVLVTATRLYLVYQLGGAAEIRVFSHKGNRLDTITLPDTNIGPELVALEGDEILFQAQGFIEPPAWYRYDGILGSGSLVKTALSTTYGMGYSDAIVEAATAVSKDGAKVPLFIVKKSSTPADGKRPTILFGDGGFGRAFTPTFSSALTIWLNHGGVAAFAGVRGGGEFGEGWHRAGMLVYKQNSIDDFKAAAKYLVKNKYTSASRLVLSGKGNGGLLVGATVAQEPDIAAAAVVDRGIFDMLRLQYYPTGEVYIGEYGSVNEEIQFKALLHYSPYQNITERTGFPAMLLISASNDYKIAPWHSRKFAAQLEAANTSNTPILYKETPSGGTGRSVPFMQQLSEEAEKLAFLFKELGISFQ